MLQIATLYENHLDDARARLRVVPARLPGDARRRGPAAGRSGGRAPRPVRGADPDLRGRARAGQRADRAARGVAEDRAHLRGEAAAIRRGPSRCCATPCRPIRPGASCCPNLERLAARPRTGAGCWTSTRAWRARAPRRASASSCCACGPRCAERRMDDPSGALDEMLRSFALAPEQTPRPRRRSCGWPASPDAGRRRSASQGAAVRAAPTSCPRSWRWPATRPTWSSTRCKDLVRAFRAYLNAFRLAPEDEEIVGHLWRLAELIGSYDGPPRRRRPQQAAADAGAAAAAAAGDEADAETEVRRPTTADPEVEDAERHGRRRRRRGHRRRRRRRRWPSRPTRPASTARPPPTPRPTERSTTAQTTPAPVSADALDVERQRLDPRRRRRHRARSREDADVIEELDAELLEVTPPPQPTARPLPRRPRLRAAPIEDEPFATPWEELAARLRRAPRRRHRHPPSSTCARSSRSGSAGRRTSTARSTRSSGPSASTSRTPRCARSSSAIGGQDDSWDRVVRDLPGRHRRVRPRRQRGGAAPRRRAPARELGQTDKAEELYQEILRLKSDDEVALERVEQMYRDQERWEDLANVLEKRTAGTERGAAAGARAAGAAARAGGSVRGAAGAPLRGDRHARALLLEADEDERSPANRLRRRARARSLEAHEALVRLYSRVGLWPKVVEQPAAAGRADRRTGSRRATLRLRGGDGLREGAGAVPSGRSRPTRRSWPDRPTTRRRWRRWIA